MPTRKPTPEQVAALETATNALEAARDLARREPTAEHREAVKALWTACDAAYVAAYGPRKVTGYASRAGVRQARERRALHRQG